VEPREIARLGRHVADAGEPFRSEARDEVAIAGEVREHRIEPGLSFAPGGERGDLAERAEPTAQGARQRQEAAAPRAGPERAARAQRRPGMLNALVAEVSVIVRASTSCESDANGMWRWGGKTRSAWISSATTTRSRASASSASASSSRRSSTRPVGLCGLQS